MKSKSTLIISGLLLSILMMSCGDCPTNETAKEKAVKVENMDQSVKPGDDFYLYANGGWIKNNPVPDDKTQYGSFTVLYDQNQIKLQDLVLEAAKSQAEKGSIAQKIGDLYNSGMDTTTINKLGYQPIANELAAIDAMKSQEDILPLVAQMHIDGVSPLFYFFNNFNV